MDISLLTGGQVLHAVHMVNRLLTGSQLMEGRKVGR